MRVAVFREFGGPEVVKVEDWPRPEAGAGEVLVEVRAVALNHLDLWVRRGGLPIDTPMPHIGGTDMAGVVAETGPGVEGFAPGDAVVLNPSLWCGRCEWCVRGEESLCRNFQVFGEHTQGALAEYVSVPARNLLPMPSDFEFTAAAAAPLAYLTAWRGLITRGRLRVGESVLITGASGGVATAAIQIARLVGARVYAATTGEHVERVRELGADVVFDREKQDVSREVWSATGKRGVDVVFDSVGEAMWTGNLRALARGGRLVVYGATTGPNAESDLRLIFWKQLEIIGTTMSSRHEFETVMRLVFEGRLRPVIDQVFPLERAADAHARLEAGDQFGKVVLVP